MKKIFISFLIVFMLFMVSCFNDSNSKQNNNQGTTNNVHVHSYQTVVIEQKCATDGYTLHYCSCGDSYKDNIKTATGHEWEEKEQNFKCKKCGRYEDEGFTFELVSTSSIYFNEGSVGRGNTYDVKNISSSALEGGNVIIPRKHLGLPVTGIIRGAFYNCRKEIKEIYFPSTIKYIGSSLMSSNGQGGFTDTPVLEKIKFDNNCSNINISHSAFQACENVNSIAMPNNCVKRINHDDGRGNLFLFQDTKYYKEHKTEENGLYYLFDMLLEVDKSKVGSTIDIKSGTRIISNEVFMDNTNIKILNIPKSVIYIGVKAFYNCVNLKTINYAGSTNEYNSITIEENAFYNCSNITYNYA